MLVCPVDAHLFRQVQLYGGSGRLGHLFAVIATLPRPVLLAIVGVVLAGSLFVISRRGADTTPSVPAPSQTAPPSDPSATPQSTPPAADKDKGKLGGRGLPSRVARALDAKKTVVILFWNKGGVEDRSVKNSVDQLPRRGGRTAVFTDKVANLSSYTRITAAASVTQTPALVVVNPKGRAEVLNGYYDLQTIRQYVRNAARR
jgi:hypothetical protein